MHSDNHPGAAWSRSLVDRPVVIAHRGASGYLPEHTLASYRRAMEMGADFVEPDLVMTRDGHLIARHESRLDQTTDIAGRPEFAHLKTTKEIDGRTVTGWFSSDLTLAQIRSLRAKERLSELRPKGAAQDGVHGIPTLDEILELVAQWQKDHGRVVGVYPETKHPSHFQSLGLPMEAALVNVLHGAGYVGADAPVFIQSFEVSNLQQLSKMTQIRLVQLMLDEGGPWDQMAAGHKDMTYRSMATAEGFHRIAQYAHAVGPDKTLILPWDSNDSIDLSNATDFVQRAHAAGLQVHPYTFRAENYFLPDNLKSKLRESDQGNLQAEILMHLELGIDGFFVDFPDLGVEAVNSFLDAP